MKSIKLAAICLLAYVLSGCGSMVPPEPTSTPTATFEPTATPTETPLPPPTATITPTETPTIMPTIVPLRGDVNAPTAVRSRPSKGGDQVGGVYYPGSVNVIGRNESATWLWITNSESPTGTGWVVANAISLHGDLGRLPIVILPAGGAPTQVYPPLIYVVNGTPLPVNMPVAGSKTATVLQLVNVRVGPGLGYLMMGSIPAGTLLSVTGHLSKNEWLQIEYPSGPDGRGWIQGSLVKVNDELGGLQVYNLLGTPVSAESAPVEDATEAPTETPSGSPIPGLPTATVAGPQGEVKNQINVRVGPASKFQSLGLLNPGAKVTLTGLTLNALWYRIEYEGAPDGQAWVASSYIKVLGDMRHLPYFDNEGKPLPTQQP